MLSLRRGALVCSIVAIASVVALVLGSSAGTFSGTGRPAELSAVSGISGSNAWAVGDFFPDAGDIGDFKTVTWHFHGGTWGRVRSPSPSSYKAQLSGVDAISPTNVWAVGWYNAHSGNDFTLIEHWTGSGWKIVKSPNPGNFGNGLNGVSAVSPNNVWAVGYYGAPKTLIVHWTGNGWKKVTSQDPGGFVGNSLAAVSARTASDVWAAGYYMVGNSPHTLIEHYTGGGWHVVASPNPSNSDNELAGVTAVTGSDAWAVGYFSTHSGDRPLIEQWDGSNWSKATTPNVGKQGALQAVSGLNANDVWAVGSAGTGSVKTLILHWDGANWTKIPSPNVSSSENVLMGVSAVSASDVWAVGYYRSGSVHKTLIEHWNGASWSVK